MICDGKYTNLSEQATMEKRCLTLRRLMSLSTREETKEKGRRRMSRNRKIDFLRETFMILRAQTTREVSLIRD